MSSSKEEIMEDTSSDRSSKAEETISEDSLENSDSKCSSESTSLLADSSGDDDDGKNGTINSSDSDRVMMNSADDFSKDLDVCISVDSDEVSQNTSTGQSVSFCENRKSQRRKTCCCGPVAKCMWGVVLLCLGISSIFYTPVDILLRERMRMFPGFPAFDWWFDAPDNVLVNVFVFNATNHDRFLSGEDDYLHFEEIGPIVYKEILIHSNVTFNDNSTMTYTESRYPVFVPELNHIDLNSTIHHPNIRLLGTATLFRNAPGFLKSMLGSNVILKNTIYNYLWNYTDNLLGIARKFVPGLVPTDNMGMLHTIYENYVDEVTVYIGPRWGDRKFFTLDKVKGSSYLPNYSPKDCSDTIYNATEGLIYSQHVTKESLLYYWRKSVCRVVELRFAEEVTVNDVKAYRFDLPTNAYHRKNNTDGVDCYRGSPILPDGISDLSSCNHGFPVAVSLPHLMGVDPNFYNKTRGMKPNATRHTSYATVDPLSGTPLASRALSQVNLPVRKISGFSKKVQMFDDMILPMFWMELVETHLPDRMWHLIKFTAVHLPWIQVIISVVLIFTGLFLLWRSSVKNCAKSSSYYTQNQLDNFARKAILGEINDQKNNSIIR